MYRPMLAETAEGPFDDPLWLFEVKWDGYRAIAEIGATTRLFGRRREFTEDFRGLRELGGAGPRRVLDGEIVAVGEDGRPDFYALREKGRRLYYVAFDLLEEEGESLISRPLSERRDHLEQVLSRLDDERLVLSTAREGEGVALFRAVVELDLEGMMAKLLASPYHPGERSASWLKILNGNETVVLVPWIEETDAHEWVAGCVEDEAPRGRLLIPRPEVTEELLGETNVEKVGRRYHLNPPLRAEVSYRQLTPDGQFRHGVLKRLLPS